MVYGVSTLARRPPPFIPDAKRVGVKTKEATNRHKGECNKQAGWPGLNQELTQAGGFKRCATLRASH